YLLAFPTRRSSDLTSKSFPTVSYVPIAKVLPSGEKATDGIPVFSLWTQRTFCVFRSQSKASPASFGSPVLAANDFPSGENAMARIPKRRFFCPGAFESSAVVLAGGPSDSRNVPSVSDEELR